MAGIQLTNRWTRTATAAAALCLALAGALAPTIAATADPVQYVPGFETEALGPLPASIDGAKTVTVALSVTQDTPYVIGCDPEVTFAIGLNHTSSAPVPITIREQDPYTGVWYADHQEDNTWGPSGESATFSFADHFEVSPHQKATVHFRIAFGAGTPRGYYTAMIYAFALPIGAPGAMTVDIKATGEDQAIAVNWGSSTPPPAPAATPTTVRPTTHPATHQATAPPAAATLTAPTTAVTTSSPAADPTGPGAATTATPPTGSSPGDTRLAADRSNSRNQATGGWLLVSLAAAAVLAATLALAVRRRRAG